jgi:alpha-tubulin suppressor-like RCC1 family protein
MGANEYGQLGTGDSNTRYVPAMLVASNVVAVAAGWRDSFFIKSDGSLWAMGLNEFGALGDGTLIGTNRPEQVLTGVVAVSAGMWHTLCIRSDGTLWGTGNNSNNELGDGTTNQYDVWFPIGPSNVVAIAAGELHSLFIKSDGSLWGMGFNYLGQLGPSDGRLSNVPVEMIVPPPSPTISSISVAGTNIVVTWPTNQGGFYLESTTNVTLPAVWSAVSPGAVIVNGQFTVTNPISASRQFYRLAE